MKEFSSNKPYLIRALYEWIVDNGGTPHLMVNAEMPGVQVPNEHVNNGEIVLNIAPSAVQGLLMENDYVTFNARFSGVARSIHVPIYAVTAIWARENGLGMPFPAENAPEEISEEYIEEEKEPEQNSASAPSEQPAKAKSKSHLKIVK
ncbi:ClpXP protease specificity-enhancing factor [Pleionea sp. CnH1-48]|uniref:ClpXP protease specificity-enhancing factor n=1 Tax=Pleionea sp. CnH1-48 TaxID=2954494 RepID=UPI002097A9B1|nr:ClpXP protease specificity-enhancing factor [Pleionea sp. CnH1-48]MCO7224011.1 ClpXP protease specificity-enhancing factor [Pleionea sp. CnH1-48]